jgi:Na+/phosphate symporter
MLQEYISNIRKRIKEMIEHRDEAKRLVERLESLSHLLRKEVEKKDEADWGKVMEYMDERERVVAAIGMLGLVHPSEQKRVERVVKKDKRTMEMVEEMRDKVAAQMRRLGNEGAGRILDTRG